MMAAAAEKTEENMRKENVDRRNRSKKRSMRWLLWAAFWVLMALTVYAAEPEEPKTPITLVSVSPMGGSVVNTTPVFTLTFDKNVANVLVREHNLSQFTLTGPSGESILIHVGIADDEIYPTLKRTVEISVLQALSPGQYKLTVRKGVQAKNGTETAKDYVYFYRVRNPEPEPETEEEEETEPETEAPETTESETEETEAPETKATEPESEAKETEATEPETKVPETEGKNPEVQGSQPNSPVKEETKPGETRPQEAVQETKPQNQEEVKETKPQETEAPTLAAAEQEKPSEEEKEPGGKIFLYEITPGEASDGGFLPQAVKAELTEGTVTGAQTGERDVLSMAAAILCIGLVLLGAIYKWVSFRRNRR